MKTTFNTKAIIMVIIVTVIISILFLGGISMMKKINEQKSIKIDEINKIQVDMTSVKVNIICVEECDKVKVDFYGKAMQEIKLVSKIENKMLYVTVQRKRENLPLYEDVVLDVHIPKAYKKDLSIKTLSGDVKIDSFNFKNFIFDTSSGKLYTEQLKTDNIFITSSSGKLEFKKIDTEILDIKGESSAIKIDNCIANKTAIKTLSGRVFVVYEEFDDKNINLVTSSGNITLELPKTAEFLLEAETSSGKFKSDFPIKIIDKKDIKAQIGTKNNKVLIKTSSANINIVNK